MPKCGTQFSTVKFSNTDNSTSVFGPFNFIDWILDFIPDIGNVIAMKVLKHSRITEGSHSTTRGQI